MIQDIMQDRVSRNEELIANDSESGHQSGQSVPIGNTHKFKEFGEVIIEYDFRNENKAATSNDTNLICFENRS